MSVTDELVRYVKQHFLDRPQFLQSAGIEDQLLRDLVSAHALPGPIYKIWRNGSFWSSIGGQVGVVAGELASEWFSPAAVWWARRAKLLAASQHAAPGQIASALRAAFCKDFVNTVRADENSGSGHSGSLLADADEQRMQDMALAEWNDWIEGGYGVCLRRFDAWHLVSKTKETTRVRHLTADGQKHELTVEETMDLLDALDRLDAVMLPFAPHQRPFGTPGKWIDAILAKYQLGSIPMVQHQSGLKSMPTDERHCA
jgi:hypothetical protein